MDKKQKSALRIAAGTAIALVVGGGGAYWWNTQRIAAAQLPPGADVVPQNALMTASFSTDPGQWRKLRQFGTPATQGAFDQNLVQLRDRLLTANGYTYERDIQPWVGNQVTVAFLSGELPPSTPSPSSSPTPTAEPPQSQSAVILLPIANSTKAQQLLTKRHNAADELAAHDYKGIQIREFKGKAQNYFSTVIDQRLIVVSQDKQAIERIVDTDQGGTSIAKTPGYSQAVNQLKADQSFMQVYVNVPVANTAIAASSNRPLVTQGLVPMQNNQGIAGTVALEPNGIRFQGVGWLHSTDSLRYKVSNSAERILSLLPAETLMAASGGSFSQLWQDYSQGVTAGSAAFLRQGMSGITGLDLDKDLIAWMDGEFSLALLPIAATGATPESMGLLFLAQSSDRRAADAAFTKLDEAMSSRYRFQVSQGQVKGKPVINWVSPFAAINATHGWLDGNVAFLALNSPVVNTILPQPQKTLAADPLFQKAIASELDSNNGHFFVNLDRLTSANSALSLPYLPPQATSLLQAMQTIGITTAIQDDRTTRYDMLVTLDKTENTRSLPVPTEERSPTPSTAENGSPSPAAGIK
jgi:hypothetical protein